MNKQALTIFVLLCAAELTHCAPGLSKGYVKPRCKQGLNDEAGLGVANSQGAAVLESRLAYEARDITPGARIWNFFWTSIESSIVSSTTPLNCPANYEMIPRNAQELQQKGYHKYHCWSTAVASGWAQMLKLSISGQSQNAIVMWAAPHQYIYPTCRGQGGGVGQLSCVPRDDAMTDWEDYVTFMSTEFSGLISHWIVWNEVASASWFDYSPVVNNVGPNVTEHDYQLWINKYVDMVDRTTNVLQRTGAHGVIVDISLDAIWEYPGWHPAHLGGKNFLNGFWAAAGVSRFDWSIAAHPYMQALVSGWPGSFRFIDLPHVLEYQLQQLNARKVPNPDQAPQMFISLTEQDYPNVTAVLRATFVCQAHSVMMAHPELLFTTHNYFQGIGRYDPYSMLDPHTPVNLANALAVDIVYAAYTATSITYWGKTNNNWCCVNTKLGCL